MTNPLDLLLPVTPPPPDRHVYGTVTATSPLRVRLDSDSVSLPIAPTTLADVVVGDRVMVLVKGLQRIVLGKVMGGGMPIGLPYVNTLETAISPGPNSTLTGLTHPAVDIRAGQSYEITAHLDVAVSSGFAIISMALGGYEWPGQIVSSLVGRTPLIRTWHVNAITTGVRSVTLQTTATSGAFSVQATHSTLTIMRTR